MKRKSLHARTISRVPPDAFVEDISPNKEAENARVIILGTENTGKTSIFNQLRYFCGANSIDENELKKCKILCIARIVLIAKQLSEYCITLQMKHDVDVSVLDQNQKLIVKYASMRHNSIMNFVKNSDIASIKNEIKSILCDPGVIKTYSHKNYFFNKIENCQYFLNKTHKFFDRKYMPTFEDYCYIHHTNDDGIYDEIASLNKSWNLSMTDVSGKRSQRTLWASILNVRYTCCLFVLSLSSFNQYYPQPLYGNKLIESLELLHSLVSLEQFENYPIVIILNKRDIFGEALQKYKTSFYDNFPLFLTRRFHFKNRSIEHKDSIYDEDTNRLSNVKRQNKLMTGIRFDQTKEFDPNYCIQFIKQELLNILPSKLQKKVRFYITCSVDTETFKFVLQTLTNEIVHMEQEYKQQINAQRKKKD